MEKVLVITGIGDTTDHLERATRLWPCRYGLDPVMHVFGWEGMPDVFDDRLSRLREHCADIGATAVVGVSAGASAGAILATEMPDLTYINVCGRLHEEGNNIYNYEQYRTRAPMFVESVKRAEAVLSEIDRERSMIFRAPLDELVPREASFVEGVPTETLPMPTHRLGIYYALRFRGARIAHKIYS